MLLIQVGCATTPRPVEGHDLVFPSCTTSPLQLVFGLLDTDCSSGPDRRGSIRVELREALPVDGSGTFKLGEQGTASATWCSANEQVCVPATGGFVFINGLDEGIAVSGEYSMVFEKNRTIEGPFGAEWCSSSLPCEKTR